MLTGIIMFTLFMFVDGIFKLIRGLRLKSKWRKNTIEIPGEIIELVEKNKMISDTIAHGKRDEGFCYTYSVKSLVDGEDLIASFEERVDKNKTTKYQIGQKVDVVYNTKTKEIITKLELLKDYNAGIKRLLGSLFGLVSLIVIIILCVLANK